MYLFAAFWFIPIQDFRFVAARSKDIAWTVPCVFLVPGADLEKRHGSEEIFASPRRPVVGQWHLIVFLPAFTIMMKRLGLEITVPSSRGLGNLNISSFSLARSNGNACDYPLDRFSEFTPRTGLVASPSAGALSSHVRARYADSENDILKEPLHDKPYVMKEDDAELKQEIHQLKRRITLLEKAFDSILTSDDSKAIKDARRDLARGQTVDLSEVKKKHP